MICDKAQAIALQKFTKPATRRFFYACARWVGILLLLAAMGSLLTGCDDLQAAHAQAVEAVADQQDREALSSREWAGQQVCGAGMTAVWESDQVLACYRNTRLAQGVGK